MLEKKWIKSTLAVTSIVAGMAGSIYALYKYDTKWSTVINTKNAVRVIKEIPANKKITKDDVELQPIKIDYLVDGVIGNINEVLGKEALILMKKGEQVTKEKIDDVSLLPSKEDGVIATIPDTWILNMPDTLRRKDKITIWVTRPVNKQIQQANNQVNTQNQTGTPSVGANNSDKIRSIAESGLPLLSNITVAYFRDSTNSEVLNPDGLNAGNSERLKGSAVPKKLEILTTKTDVKLISDAIEQGYALVIAYHK